MPRFKKNFLWPFLLIISLSAKANLIEDLTNTERLLLIQGDHLLKSRVIENKSWPEVTIYKLVPATPLECLSIFAAYDLQKEFIPGLLQSNPISHINPTEVQTAYELDLPWPLSTSKYVNGARIRKLENEGYQAEWYLVQSDSAEDGRGNATFLPFGGKTLFVYKNFVEPRSIFAPWLKSTMLKEVVASVNATTNYIQMLKTDKPTVMEKYKQMVEDALNGKNVYQEVIEQNTPKSL